jgi:hypothetical protein
MTFIHNTDKNQQVLVTIDNLLLVDLENNTYLNSHYSLYYISNIKFSATIIFSYTIKRFK